MLRLDENSTLRLSPLQASGPKASNLPKVSWRGAPPSAETTNTCEKPGFSSPSPSARQVIRSSTFSGGAQVAPSGLASGAPSLAGSSAVSIRMASDLPSGDQASSLGACSRVATWAERPLAIQRTWTCGPPGPETT